MDPELAALMAKLREVQQTDDNNNKTKQNQQQQQQRETIKLNDRQVGEILLLVQKRFFSSSSENSNNNSDNLIYTTDGRGFVTSSHLVKEVIREVQSHNGRVSICDLPNILFVDMCHVDRAVKQAMESEEGKKLQLRLLDHGNLCLISSKFFDSVVADARAQLGRRGSLIVVDFAKQQFLPVAFVEEILRNASSKLLLSSGVSSSNAEDAARSNTIRFDATNSVAYAPACIERQLRILLCALLARRTPVSVADVYQRHGSDVLIPALMSEVTAKLVEIQQQQGQESLTAALPRLPGKLDPKSGLYTPGSYDAAINSAWHEQYTTAGWISFAALTKLGISNPATFLSSKYNNNNSDSGAEQQQQQQPAKRAGKKRGGTSTATNTTSVATIDLDATPNYGHVLSQAFVSERVLRAAASALDVEVEMAFQQALLASNGSNDDKNNNSAPTKLLWHISDLVPSGVVHSADDCSKIAARLVELKPSITEHCNLVVADDEQHHRDNNSTSSVEGVFFLSKMFLRSVAPAIVAAAAAAIKRRPRHHITPAGLVLARPVPSGQPQIGERDYVALIYNVIAAENGGIDSSIAAACSLPTSVSSAAVVIHAIRSFHSDDLREIVHRVCVPSRSLEQQQQQRSADSMSMMMSASSSSMLIGAAPPAASSSSGLPSQSNYYTKEQLEFVFLRCQLLKKVSAAAALSSSPIVNKFLVATTGAALVRLILLDIMCGLHLELPQEQQMNVQQIIETKFGGEDKKKVLALLKAMNEAQQQADNSNSGSFAQFVDTVQGLVSRGEVGSVSASLKQLGKKQERDAFRAEADSLLQQGKTNNKAALVEMFSSAIALASWIIATVNYHVLGETSVLWCPVFDPASLASVSGDFAHAALSEVAKPILACGIVADDDDDDPKTIPAAVKEAVATLLERIKKEGCSLHLEESFVVSTVEMVLSLLA